MPKKSLKEQIQSIEYRDADTEDFDDIIDTTPEKVTSSAKNKITMLPLRKSLAARSRFGSILRKT